MITPLLKCRQRRKAGDPQGAPLLWLHRAIQLHAGDEVSHGLESPQGRCIDLEGKQGDRLVPPHHGRMRRGQARENGVLRSPDGVGALRRVTSFRDLKGDEHPGPPDTDKSADLGIDHGIGSRHAGTQRGHTHDLCNEKRDDPDAHV